MKEATGNYLLKRPYRKKHMRSSEGKELIRLMTQGFSSPFNGYWEQFGYEIGGPVCYGYSRWIMEQLEQHPDISDLAFVARDGWLLKKVYDMLPHQCTLNSRYIYAPRSVKQLCQRDPEQQAMYRAYLAGQMQGEGTIAVIDTVTMKFSSQQFLAVSTDRKTHGFFWLVLDGEKDYGAGYSYSSYQAVRHHTINCWNIMEFIMTSPEPPICGMEGDRPIYRTPNQFEAIRGAMFTEMEKGVLRFVADVCRDGQFPSFTNEFLTAWVNGFLCHPDQEDAAAFEAVMFSEREDHSDCIPLDPFGQSGPSLKKLKDRLWLFSQRHKQFYRAMHAVNVIRETVQTRLQGTTYLKFNGEKPWELVDQLTKYDVISFDIFDTLLFRNVEKPTDLFFQLEKELGEPGFHDKRIRAEQDVRRKTGQLQAEIDIFAIYRELSKHISLEAETGVQREFEAEKQTCFPNPAIKEVYRLLAESGCRMIAVSDMYLPELYLRKLLDTCGFGGIERVFVSCEYGAGKGNGVLQRMVQAELGDSLRIIHIGDNLSSDVYGSRKAGWGAVWYQCTKRTAGESASESI